MTHYLPNGYELNRPDGQGEYIIKKVKGLGASTIAYLVDFIDASGRVSERILKEFYPSNLEVLRDGNGGLLCTEKDLQKYRDEINRFVAAGDRQNILREYVYLTNETPPLQKIFEANNTCYLEITPYTGKTFDNIESFTLPERIKLCLTTAKLIKRYHEEGFLYLDIKPENIFVLTNSSGAYVTDMVVLIDFDSIIEKDAIKFGASLSCTEAWAAPEQIIPYGYSKISEATDIYALGELVFWCVFNRHSFPGEHRGFSHYPYNEILSKPIRDLLRHPVRKQLNYLYQNTIRSSICNRFQSVDSVIAVLENVCDELAKREKILAAESQAKPFFVGREKELYDISVALQENKIVFVSGIAGVGKSELIKQYIKNNKYEYDNILCWTYEGNLDSMVSNDISVSISNFGRIQEETDCQYAERKLKKIRELIEKGNNLFVIDNMDVLIDDIEEKNTWELIKSLNCKILVSTRSTENIYFTVRVDTIEDVADLEVIFRKYCQVEDNQHDYIVKIIEEINHHTLLTELLAHYTQATHSTPKTTLEKLKKSGIRGLSDERIRILKDDRISSESVFSHVKKVFTMSSMTDAQLLVLAKLALMPTDGVTTTKFKTFFSLDNYDIINWLIAYGWISDCDNNGHSIKLHPTIAAVVMEYMKNNKKLPEKLYVDSYNAIRLRRKGILESEQINYADSIAFATTNKFFVSTRSAAVFIEQYVNLYSKYGNSQLKLRQIEFAIDTLQRTIEKCKYSGILEQCFFLKAAMQADMLQYANAIDLCERHFYLAKENKDYYFAAKWSLTLSMLYISYDTQGSFFSKQLKYYWIGLIYLLKIGIDSKRKEPHFLLSSNLLKRLDYDYMEQNKSRFRNNLMLFFATWMENQKSHELFCTRCSKQELKNLKRAKSIRASVRRKKHSLISSNSLEINIDSARIAFLKHQYKETEALLNKVKELFAQRKLNDTYTLYRVHQFLGHIALKRTPCDFENAISEFEECLRISDRLGCVKTYMVRLELAYCYINAGRKDEATRLNQDLLHETQSLAPEIRKTYYADALRNMGFLYYIQDENFAALNSLNEALHEYDNAKAHAPSELIDFGRARTHKHLSDLCYVNNIGLKNGVDKAIKQMEKAIECYGFCVGRDHPEAQNCIQQLEILKSKKTIFNKQQVK